MGLIIIGLFRDDSQAPRQLAVLDENERWWAMLGSNQRPLPCEDSALPLS